MLTPSMSATRRRDPAGIVIFGSGLILSNRPSDFLPESALVSEGPLVQPAVLASHIEKLLHVALLLTHSHQELHQSAAGNVEVFAV